MKTHFKQSLLWASTESELKEGYVAGDVYQTFLIRIVSTLGESDESLMDRAFDYWVEEVLRWMLWGKYHEYSDYGYPAYQLSGWYETVGRGFHFGDTVRITYYGHRPKITITRDDNRYPPWSKQCQVLGRLSFTHKPKEDDDR